MKNPFLSICIPTFNRSNYLNELITLLLEEIGDRKDIQIVISDNNSNDNTPEIVAANFKNNNLIKYIRQSYNKGVSENIIDVVNYADGYYCAIFGDDDLVRRGWFDLLISDLMKHDPDIVVSDRVLCDINMNPMFVEVCGPKVENTQLFNFKDINLLKEYLSQTMSTSGFGFLSNLVVKRSSWNVAANIANINKHAFPHMLKCMDICYRFGGTLLRIPLPSVLARSGNDRLEEMRNVTVLSDFEKMQIHFDGFMSVADMIFEHDPELWKAFLSPLYNIFSDDYCLKYIATASEYGLDGMAKAFLYKLKNNHSMG